MRRLNEEWADAVLVLSSVETYDVGRAELPGANTARRKWGAELPGADTARRKWGAELPGADTARRKWRAELPGADTARRKCLLSKLLYEAMC
jgi:hypothetical protein